VVLEDGYRTLPAQIELDKPNGKGMWLRVTLKEGRKRQIREVGKRLGLPVVKIMRIRIGSLLLGNLKSREWRALTPQEIASLKMPSASQKSNPRKPRSAEGVKKTVRPHPKAH
jgi:23S rRNA pseudouridine2605 synthase